jgi:hypothetical protein
MLRVETPRGELILGFCECGYGPFALIGEHYAGIVFGEGNPLPPDEGAKRVVCNAPRKPALVCAGTIHNRLTGFYGLIAPNVEQHRTLCPCHRVLSFLTFLGRPPRFPLARLAACLAGVVASPPFLPMVAR